MQGLTDVAAIFDLLDKPEGILAAEKAVYGSGSVCEHFREHVNKELARLGDNREALLRAGLAQYVLGQYRQSADLLHRAKDNGLRRFYQGRVNRILRQYDDAKLNLDRAVNQGWDEFATGMEQVQTLREAGQMQEADKLLQKHAKNHDNAPDYLFQLGALRDQEGRKEEAVNALEKALQINPTHQAANFKLAYIHDLAGEEQQAVELYRRATSTPPIHVNALINLAVLLEDVGLYEDALTCLQQVLAVHPNHPRARLFFKDCEASLDMEYDEDAERMRSKRDAIMSTPITNFELSVRCRNCLKKLSVLTIGDLLKISEVQLRQYKNFGESSLQEIRELLSARGLKIGQLLEEAQMPRRPLAALRRSLLGAAAGSDQPAQPEQQNNLLSKPVVELELSVRSRKCLQRLNVGTVGELIQHSEAELMGIKNFGQTSLSEIKNRLEELGLSLKAPVAV